VEVRTTGQVAFGSSTMSRLGVVPTRPDTAASGPPGLIHRVLPVFASRLSRLQPLVTGWVHGRWRMNGRPAARYSWPSSRSIDCVHRTWPSRHPYAVIVGPPRSA